MMESLAFLEEAVGRHFRGAAAVQETSLKEMFISTSPATLQGLVAFLRDTPSCRFRQLMDICGVDYLERTPRFDVVYHLLSVEHNLRVRVKVPVTAGETVPSLISLFKSAGWWERETWDMFGIPFAGHPDLRRILTDYDFEGFPLRKDFPLLGHYEVHYDEARQAVVREKVALPQAYRDFDFETSWEGVPRNQEQKEE